MEEQKEIGKGSLESSKKLISCNVYTWKMPNFFSLPEYKEDIDFEISSPSFDFQNATWCFSLGSYKNSKHIFSLYIRRLKTDIPTHMLFFKFAFSNNNVKWCDYSSFRFMKGKQCFNDFDSNDFSFQDELTVTVHLFTFEPTKVDAKQVSLEKDSLFKRPVEMKSSKMSFESTTKAASSDFFSWTFPNVFDKCKTELHNAGEELEISSPTFNFANETCCIRIALNGCCCINVGLEVFNAENSLRNVFTKFILTNCNGETMGNYFSEVDLTKKHKWLLTTFKRVNSPSCTLHVQLLLVEELQLEIRKARCSNLLFQDLKKIFLTGEDSDLTLKVAEKEFQVHRVILKARSKVFEAMLSSDMIEQNNGIVNIPDVDAQAMELLLLYLYSGDVDGLDSDNALGVYYAADKYNLMFLKEESAEFIKKSLSPTIICNAIQLALNHNDRDLLKHCKEYFVNHAGDILLTVEWMSFLVSNPIAANELYIKAYYK